MLFRSRAEAWYRKALEIYECLGHTPLKVNTLTQMGTLRQRQNRPEDAISWYGQALSIATAYNMRVGSQILVHLAQLLDALGEERFNAVWEQAFPGQAPPLDLLHDTLKQPKEHPQP